MGKLGGIIFVSVLGLTSCATAQAAPQGTPAPAKFADAAPAITAAAIPAAEPTKTEVAKPGTFGDRATDEKYLLGVKAGWLGAAPEDAALIGAAKLACQKYAAGERHDTMRVVQGTSNEAMENNLRVAVYAARNYCTAYNPDN